MYTALIVEDEVLEREVLDDILSNSYPQIQEVYTADNGIDALRIAQEKMPDIVLIDINIPGIDGLRLLRELADNGFPGKCIITTAYDTFDYAKEAIRYGAIDYLLKPILDSELEKSLEKAFSSICQERSLHQAEQDLSSRIHCICSYAQRYLVRDLLQGHIQEYAMTSAYGWAPDGKLLARMLLIEWEEEPSIPIQNEVISLLADTFSPLYSTLLSFEGNRLWLMIHPHKPDEVGQLEVSCWAFAQSVASHLPEGAGDIRILATPLCSSYLTLQTMAKALPQTPPKGTADESCPALCFKPTLDGKIYPTKEEGARIQKAVRYLRTGESTRITGLFRACFEDPQTTMLGIYLILKAMVLYDPSVDIADAYLSAHGLNPETGISQWLSANIPSAHASAKEENPIHSAISQALEILHAEYASPDLSQQLVAERLGLSSAYFSRLFKKETGKNFVPVLTQIRMEHAKELLDKGTSLEETALRCGYLNKKYFYDIFKMHFGISASLYAQKASQALP